MELGCKNIENGSFSSYVKLDARDQAHQLATVIQTLLQAKPRPGSAPVGIYTEDVVITKDTLILRHPASRWTRSKPATDGEDQSWASAANGACPVLDFRGHSMAAVEVYTRWRYRLLPTTWSGRFCRRHGSTTPSQSRF